MTVYVLWENHATGPIEKFGPHAFLTACVANQLGLDPFALRRSRSISGVSCGGDSNVLRKLEAGPSWDIAPHLIAVLDTDKLDVLLGGGEPRRSVSEPGYTAWSDQMAARCRRRIGDHEVTRLTIAFLDRNLETLLRVLGGDTSEKDVVARDKILGRASASPDLIHRASAQMPTWAALVDAVARRL